MAKAGRASRTGSAKAEISSGTRGALVDAAIESLRFDGFTGASARAIATRAGLNPGLIFYHFGSVVDLLVAGLEWVSVRRMERYSAAVDAAVTPSEMVAAATEIFREDLDEGYVTVLVEMIAGAASSPGLGDRVAELMTPWRTFSQNALAAIVSESPLASLVPVEDAAHAIVALYLGLEMLAHLDGDRAPALRLFEHASQLVVLLGALSPTLEAKDTP